MDRSTLIQRTIDSDAYLPHGEQVCQSGGMEQSRSVCLYGGTISSTDTIAQDFQKNHYKYWGKLYKPEDVKVSAILRCLVD
jgi:hypothetical protein